MGNQGGVSYLDELNNNDSFDLRSLNLINDLPYLDLIELLDINSKYYDETQFVSSFSDPSKVVIMSCNICSIQSKFLEFNNLLDNLAEKNALPDLILIQESWVHDHSHLNIKGFKAILNARPSGSRGGGCMIYYNELFNVEHINNEAFFHPNILETSVLLINIPGKTKFIVSSLYRPNCHRTLAANEQVDKF